MNRALLPVCAPLPALLIGIEAMRQLGASTMAWSINIAATVLGLLIWFAGRRLAPPSRPMTRAVLTAIGIAAILLPFATEGIEGVHRWIPIAGLRLHASAIIAPLILLCVAAHKSIAAVALGVAGTMIMALQPDAAQAMSFAAACIVLLLVHTKQTSKALLSVALLLAAALVSFVRPDPLDPVAHVEEIFTIAASRGPASAVLATVALLLLPLPFFAAWYRHRRPLTLALGVYVSMTLLAPFWGTFPVPVMGFGASPILGYFIALAIGLGNASRVEERAVPEL